MPKYAFNVEVVPRFLPEQSGAGQGFYSFSYTVTVHNAGDVAAQLISRHWVISDAAGHTENVAGLGVVGHQPLLQPGAAFEYTSGCRLRTPSGTMRGSYFCVAVDGTRFNAEIAPFALVADANARVLH